MHTSHEPAPTFTLNGRQALVTGAATGIGRAIAVAYAAAGADLVLLSERDNLDEVAAVVQALGAKAACVRFDLADADGRTGFVEALLDDHDIDVLVNNAGLIRRAPSETFADDDWYDVIEVNTHAAFHLARAAGRRMLERGGGKIINIASVLSFQGGMFVPSYAASKHALAGLTRALANEWAGRGVNVNAIAPGYVETAVTEDLRDDRQRQAQITARIPAGRWATPRDIAGPAIFLASAAADYVHGHILVVDGGWLCR
ncbi:SDR family oxidoreductase [Micromonospora sp. U21]|uniref:SDR family oxidoreductase n=1 Tax=Micromonospora sp. U21 TaxID=2824899 RepID=UPI001B38A46B|nr:SDR family oxidoreductase [Micromonospora sp. U21]MBQ0901983.1 SDR family oxidoreductase [Micromonospora sp. U21]